MTVIALQLPPRSRPLNEAESRFAELADRIETMAERAENILQEMENTNGRSKFAVQS